MKRPPILVRSQNHRRALLTCGSALLLTTGWTSCEEQGLLEPYLKQGFIDQYHRYHVYVPPPPPPPPEPEQIEVTSSCDFPLLGAQPVTTVVSYLIDPSLEVGRATGAISFDLEVTFGDQLVEGMSLAGGATLAGEAEISLRLTGPGLELPLTVPVELPAVSLDFGAPRIITTGSGQTPSLSFNEPGLIDYWLDDIDFELVSFGPDGSPAPAPLETFEVACDLAAAPISLASTEILAPPPPPFEPMPEPLPEAAPELDVSVGEERFSGTNLQETSVDESDWVKQNGEHLYAVQLPGGLQGASASKAPVIHTYRTTGSPVTSARQSSVELTGATDVTGLYLRDQQLIALTRSYYDESPRDLSNASRYYDPWAWQNASTDIRVLSLTAPEQPESTLTLSFEGSLIESRVIAGQLYVATKFTPQHPFPYRSLPSESDSSWADRINAIPLTDFLPQIRVNGEPAGHLFADGRCHLPDQDEAAQRGYTSIVAVIRINLDNPSDWEAKCNSGRIHGVYASRDAFVLTGYDDQSYDSTRLDWYDLQPFRLKASGSVPGTLDGSMPSFRLSEVNDTLRIVTSSDNFWLWEPIPFDLVGTTAAASETGVPAPGGDDLVERNEWDHRLFVLRADADRTLGLVGQLPNEARPAPIGKPGETVRSVRYEPDRAYVVTFRQTDPLYVINLDDPADPYIEGELEIEGFSSYLHPLPNDLLLGVGQDATADGLLQGLKLTLFDASDASNPTELSSTYLGARGSSTPVLADHKAISFLTEGDMTRMAFTWNEFDDWRWTADRVYVADIDTSRAVLTERLNSAYATPTTSSSIYGSYLGYTRVPLQGDGLHLVINGHVYSGNLDDWVAPTLP